MPNTKKIFLKEYHRFLDESGDTTFYGKGKKIIIGENGVSKCFIIGMVKFKSKLETIRKKLIDMQNEITHDDYFFDIPSIKKRGLIKDIIFMQKTTSLKFVKKLCDLSKL